MISYLTRIEIPNNPFQLLEENMLVKLYRLSQRRGGIRFFLAWIADVVVSFWGVRKIRNGTSIQLDACALSIGEKEFKKFSITDSNAQFYCVYSPQYRNLYEIEVEATLEMFLPRDGHFIDIGSNWGYYGIKLALQHEKNVKVVSFEPSERSYADLVRIKKQLSLGESFKTFNIALSSQGGAIRLVQHWFESGLATTKADVSDHIRSKNFGIVKRFFHSGEISEWVETRTLDSMGIEGCDVMKVDVEGAELDVLKGAQQVLARFRPIVIFEHWYQGEKNFHDYVEFWDKRDYILYQAKGRALGDNKAKSTTRVEFTLSKMQMELNHQYNLIAVPTSKDLAVYFR